MEPVDPRIDPRLVPAGSRAEMLGILKPSRAETPDPCPRSDIGSRDEMLGLDHLQTETR